MRGQEQQGNKKKQRSARTAAMEVFEAIKTRKSWDWDDSDDEYNDDDADCWCE